MLELQANGIVFTETGQYEGTRWAHFSDPEGNQLEIKVI
jgi:predicted enzyme related to lactoylglutathione lyase